MANITYVDENDNIIGAGTIANAQKKGIVHRIARILVFNSSGELLLQKRSLVVDSPGKWDQSAGGHVDEGEDYKSAATRELEEEVGIANVPLKFISKYFFKENVNSKVLKRFNALYVAIYNGPIVFDKEEVLETKWINLVELERQIRDHSNNFTEGFIICYEEYKKHML